MFVSRSAPPPSTPNAASDPSLPGLLELARCTQSDAVRYHSKARMADITNAHRTNTVEDLTSALNSGFTQFEADLRRTLQPPYELECRHDPGPEAGTNLPFKDWLRVMVASDRRIKVDIKDNSVMPDLVAQLQAAHLPSGKLNFSLSDVLTETWGAKLRALFPDAILSINCPMKLSEDVLPRQFSPAEIEWYREWTRQLGGKVTLMAGLEQIGPQNIPELERIAPLSVFNEPSVGHTPHPAAKRDELRREGVTGIIDLEKTLGPLGKAKVYAQYAWSSFEAGLAHRFGRHPK